MEQPRLTPIDRRRNNERVVHRYESTGIRVLWFPPTRTLLGTQPRKAVADVLDLSVSGALLCAPANPKVRPGTLVEVRHDRARGVVEVRHVAASPDGERRCRYGVQFLRMEEPLRTWVYDVVAAHRGDDDRLEEAWRTAP